MANEDVLKKVTNYLMHTNTKLQMAAGKFNFFLKSKVCFTSIFCSIILDLSTYDDLCLLKTFQKRRKLG